MFIGDYYQQAFKKVIYFDVFVLELHLATAQVTMIIFLVKLVID